MPAERTQAPALELSDVVRRFGDTVALDGFSLAVPPGSILGLVGRNGAGKTTAIRLLAGLLTPHAGCVRVAGADPVADRRAVMANAGFLLDELALFPYLTPLETLQWLGEAYGQAAAVAAGRAEELLLFFGLTDIRDRLAEDLSTGMRKRLALAAAMVHAPGVLVLDEPFESLDPLMVRRLKELLRRYARAGGAVLLSSHLVDVVEELCDRLAILERGALCAAGLTRQVLAGADPNLPPHKLEGLYVSLVPADPEVTLDWMIGGGAVL